MPFAEAALYSPFAERELDYHLAMAEVYRSTFRLLSVPQTRNEARARVGLDPLDDGGMELVCFDEAPDADR